MLAETGLELCDDDLPFVSALGRESLVAEFTDSIVQPPLLHTHPEAILPTDRRYVRYRTYCILRGKGEPGRLSSAVSRGASIQLAQKRQENSMIRKLSSGQYRLYSRKKNPKTGKRRNLGTFGTRKAAEAHERDVQYFKRQG